MQFDNKIGSIQQILTATNVGVLRRQAILKELNLKKKPTNYRYWLWWWTPRRRNFHEYRAFR